MYICQCIHFFLYYMHKYACMLLLHKTKLMYLKIKIAKMDKKQFFEDSSKYCVPQKNECHTCFFLYSSWVNYPFKTESKSVQLNLDYFFLFSLFFKCDNNTQPPWVQLKVWAKVTVDIESHPPPCEASAFSWLCAALPAPWISGAIESVQAST